MNELELKNYFLLYKSKEELVDMIYNARQYIKNIDDEEFINTEHYVELLEILGDKE